jgi:hypothetical protein
MPIREQIVAVAYEISAAGAHYLTGCYGSRPGQADYAGRWLGMVYNNEWRSVAVQAAMSKVNGLVCCGRYMDDSRKILAGLTPDPPENDLGRWVGALPPCRPDKSGPQGVATLTAIRPYMERYWPRRHGGDNARYIYLGESCAGKMHFDCVGFVCYVLARVLGHPIQVDLRLPQNWPGRCTEIAEGQTGAGPGDIVFTDRHIALVMGSGGSQLIHANGDKRGVERTSFNSGAETWSGRNPRWFRLLDSFLR